MTVASRWRACKLALLTHEARAAGLRRMKEALAEGKARGESPRFVTEVELGVLVGRTSEKEDIL